MIKFEPRPHQQDMLWSMDMNDKGIVHCPVGGGKTYTFITDSRKYLIDNPIKTSCNESGSRVVVVVAPQLLLSNQLFKEFDKHLKDINFLWRQVSSESKTYERDRQDLKFRVVPPKSPTTIVEEIRDTYRIAQKVNKPLILFTTYDSLNRIVSSMIPVDVVYYDEAHNATSSDNFNAVKYMSSHAKRNYFFTATPRYSTDYASDLSGMNNTDVYGDIICKVDFNYLVEQGVIVKPKLHLMKSDADLNNQREVDVNMKTIVEVVDHYENVFTETENHKLLFCAQGTKSIQDLLTSPQFIEFTTQRGYKVLSIDSVNQGYVDGQKKVSKTTFIDHLNSIGNNPHQKMIVLHYAMLGEGIDVKSFTGVVFLRKSMASIFATQSIGRVIRATPGKPYGVVTVVQHDSDTGESREIVKSIVKSLIEVGVPPDYFISEDEEGRVIDSEVVQNLDQDHRTIIRDIAIRFEHSNMLAKLLEMDMEEISF